MGKPARQTRTAVPLQQSCGLSEQRLLLTTGGKERYQLKTLWCNGTTHVVLEPLDFLSKLATPVPRSQVNLTRDYVFLARKQCALARLRSFWILAARLI
ncbi:MAG: transposase [Betaproteobacteria bacterium]|nr:MAG: transposase [Betaproteobacteria bacterium]